MEEQWVAVPNFPNYEVSNYGEFRRTVGGTNTYKHRKRKLSKNADGYLFTTLYHGQTRILAYPHRIVATLFLGPRPNGMEVNHKDGCKENNAVSNLEYVTPKENIQHAFRHGLRVALRGEQIGNSKLDCYAIVCIRQLSLNGMSHTEIGEMFGVSDSSVDQIASGQTWKHIQEPYIDYVAHKEFRRKIRSKNIWRGRKEKP